MQKGERPAVNIANSIQMKRSQNPTRTDLVVEGEDDKAFFGRYTDPKACHIAVAHGKPNVRDVILELDKRGFRGTLGIVDADFDVLEQRGLPSPNLIATDLHDVECMMLASPAFEHLLRELGDQELRGSFEKQRGTVVEQLLTMGREIGYLRWASARNEWSLKFEGLDFGKFIREKSFSFELRSLFEALRNHQGGQRVGPVPSVDEMQVGVDALRSSTHDLWHVCCGHDLVELLSIGLRKVLGQHNDASVDRKLLERQLRLAYEEGYFRRTVLYVRIREWEERNYPFRVLPFASA
jgi:hypothetical protein